MKITVDEEGHLTPDSSAQFGAWVGETEVIPARVQVPSPVPPHISLSGRIFWCAECRQPFLARSGQTTTHECDAD